MVEQCDCLNECGDDPRLHAYEVVPCEGRIRQRHRRRRELEDEVRRREALLTCTQYRFALYSRADRLGLAADRGQPVALFACRATAEAHGRKLYGAMAEVVELAVDEALQP